MSTNRCTSVTKLCTLDNESIDFGEETLSRLLLCPPRKETLHAMQVAAAPQKTPRLLHAQLRGPPALGDAGTLLNLLRTTRTSHARDPGRNRSASDTPQRLATQTRGARTVQKRQVKLLCKG